MSSPTTRSRPHIPGYGVPEADEGLLSWAWAVERIEKARNYWVSTTRPDGRPHAVPVWGVWVDGVLYFGGGESTRWARNLKANPHISVHLESGDEVVIIEGVMDTMSERETGKRAGRAYAIKYEGKTDEELNAANTEPNAGTVWYTVRPQTVFAWGKYPDTCTRWTF